MSEISKKKGNKAWVISPEFDGGEFWVESGERSSPHGGIGFYVLGPVTRAGAIAKARRLARIILEQPPSKGSILADVFDPEWRRRTPPPGDDPEPLF